MCGPQSAAGTSHTHANDIDSVNTELNTELNTALNTELNTAFPSNPLSAARRSIRNIHLSRLTRISERSCWRVLK